MSTHRSTAERLHRRERRWGRGQSGVVACAGHRRRCLSPEPVRFVRVEPRGNAIHFNTIRKDVTAGLPNDKCRPRVRYVQRATNAPEGDTLVVETTNFTDKTAIGRTQHSAVLKTTERFSRVSDDTLVYEITIEDPATWAAPWTIQLPLKRDDNYGMFEYACHEGNRAMANILSGARAAER